MKKACFYLSFILLLSACEQADYLVQKQLPGECWSSVEPLSYDHDGSSGLYAQVNFLPDYKYRNLYLRLIVRQDSKVLTDTLINTMLIDLEGNWLEKQQGKIFPKKIRLPLPAYEGATEILLSQYMRDDLLCDIESVGLVSDK